ncbi:MAG: phosphatidate cytidylyltransferase, partial [Vulcanimicrobiaceae bacterium]
SVTATSRGADRSAELARRTATGLALAVVVLGSVVNVFAFALVVLLVALGSLWELAQLAGRKGTALAFPLAALVVTVYVVLAALGLQHQYEKSLLALTIIASLAGSLGGPRQGYFARSAMTVFSILYIGWLSTYFLALRNLPHLGAAFAAAAVVAIAMTDIFAMLVGVAIGRTPLSPISPKKTWEGAIGGLVATTLVGGSLAFLPLGIPWWQGLFIGAVTSVAAQIGDLVESALKRDAHVKDAGRFLGEQGGILDRFDSYTFGGIAFYAALFVTGHIPPIHP